ncbi:LysR substrate-binding domain-containing protein [Dactylosporangium sp. AC04546]|uniref:LysR family transcriptional regulator n=1 Tax=Dactylosporangium sp. AC04546 TaxID=2862460 RepID=UPI001EE0D5A8|nr:LysR substrate-binding domain-containing protein [Dactylosporangium sp. AC04546]WVK79094.1 LysR substrate-binding domain-containing protein [Dactylosporangium sp. AC04546]
MELRQLEIFRAIAEERHFGRAARRLFLAQPSVSQQLQRLEAEVGVRLVHRSSRRVWLTDAGEAFLREVERVFADVDRAVRVARQVAAAGAGALRVATNYPGSRLLILPLLERLRREEPHPGLLLREMGTPDQLAALARGDLDVGLVYGPIEHPDLAARHLLDVPVVATVRAGHALAGQATVSYGEIAGQRYITGYQGGGTRIEEVLLAEAARHGVRLTPARGLSDLSSYLLELEVADAIGFSSAIRGEQHRASGMHVLRLTPTEPSLEIHVAWHRRGDEPSVNTLVEQLTELAAEARRGA